MAMPSPTPDNLPVALVRYRPWFYAAALYNLLWGASIILFPRRSMRLPGGVGDDAGAVVAGDRDAGDDLRARLLLGGIASDTGNWS